MGEDHQWANLIIQGALQEGAMAVIDAVNVLTHSGKANRGSVIVACAQMMAQTIVAANPADAREVRAGIVALIDDYAMRLATEK